MQFQLHAQIAGLNGELAGALQVSLSHLPACLAQEGPEHEEPFGSRHFEARIAHRRLRHGRHGVRHLRRGGGDCLRAGDFGQEFVGAVVMRAQQDAAGARLLGELAGLRQMAVLHLAAGIG